eukprot:gnl/TRDRNA2_/TRDRNA2_178999_c0_seq1.p1 gnl/TRDRNA2_/TRDRNA2_178999_c0~~gnl/TRDRNA2_/TRDRNA2_178999_c0_seq1.p1  ORF type:complete len:505 (-),score=56.60 gnl/TRDRNA2_/TRDRNA2_178999_c0_seq1:72-1586(-)
MKDLSGLVPGPSRSFWPHVRPQAVLAGDDQMKPLPTDVNQSHLGITICLVGYSCSALGLLMQKKGHLRQAEADDEEWRTNGTVPDKDLAHAFLPSNAGARMIFIGGLLLMGFGDGLAFLAMGLSSQSVLGPLGCTSMIVNTLLAPVILGEEVFWRHWAAVFVLCIGCTVVVITGPEAEEVGDVSANHMAKHAQRLEFALVAFAYMVIASISAFLLWRSGSRTEEDEEVTTKYSNIIPVLFATIAGIVCAFAMLVGKCASTLIWAIYFEDRTVPWVSLSLLLVFAALLGFCTFVSVNVGLRNCDATDFVPAYYSVSMLAMILLGAVFFEEFDRMVSVWYTVLFCVGVATVLLGVYILVRQDYHHVIGAESIDYATATETDGEKTILLTPEVTQRKTPIFGPAPPGFVAGQHPEVFFSPCVPEVGRGRVEEALMGFKDCDSTSKTSSPESFSKIVRSQTWACEESNPNSPAPRLLRATSGIGQVLHGHQRPHRTYSVSLFGFPGIS